MPEISMRLDRAGIAMGGVLQTFPNWSAGASSSVKRVRADFPLKWFKIPGLS